MQLLGGSCRVVKVLRRKVFGENVDSRSSSRFANVCKAPRPGTLDEQQAKRILNGHRQQDVNFLRMDVTDRRVSANLSSMATWAIGDVHGCFRTLRKLLKRIGFDPSRDRLWLTGDLVNRGPDSLGVLRWARELGERITVVLGNHDLHLLGVAWGVVSPRAKDTLEEVLGARDRDGLLDWLRHRPLAHTEGRYLLVHAGLLPEWSTAEALRIARAVQMTLTSPQARELIRLYRTGASTESFELLALRALTQLRMLDEAGLPLPGFAGPPEEGPAGSLPWFDHPKRQSRTHTVICGHWAALGLRLRVDLFALDSGCAWRGRLTGVCLEDGRLEQVEFCE